MRRNTGKVENTVQKTNFLDILYYCVGYENKM